jgi:hypothetical protein
VIAAINAPLRSGRGPGIASCWVARSWLGPLREEAAVQRLKARRKVVQFLSDHPAEHGWPHKIMFEAKPMKG